MDSDKGTISANNLQGVVANGAADAAVADEESNTTDATTFPFSDSASASASTNATTNDMSRLLSGDRKDARLLRSLRKNAVISALQRQDALKADVVQMQSKLR
jgi:Tfp pilus assembly protein PilX